MKIIIKALRQRWNPTKQGMLQLFPLLQDYPDQRCLHPRCQHLKLSVAHVARAGGKDDSVDLEGHPITGTQGKVRKETFR